MPSQKNIDQIKELKENLNKTKSVVLSDYCGLTVGQITQLRQKVKQTGGEFKVIKNTLLKLAFEDLQFSVSNFQFEGPTAILFSFKDELEPIKALYEFSKENNLPKIKIGFLEKQFLSKDKIIELAKLPSQEALQTKLAVVLNSPIYGLVYVLKANLQKLVRILTQIKMKTDDERQKGVN